MRKAPDREIVIAIPSAPPSRLPHILDHCRDVKAKARILPSVSDLIDGRAAVQALPDVDLEDLLGRDPVELDEDLLHRRITGRTVMVTGAAGSIGAELCRQLARLSPARLVLYEIAETPLFDFEMEMRGSFPTLDLIPVIGDVRDRGRVEEVMRAYGPAIVYHAAAYKHVPVMEMHPVEAVKTNVMGTRVAAEGAAVWGAERFVLVSTDKAVRPTNVMGASKRVAELVIHNMKEVGGKTAFVAVRWGEIIYSRYRSPLTCLGGVRMNYYQYIQSDAWQEKRQAALRAAGHACQVCNSGERLEVHHRTYDRLGHERQSDLTVLCHDCHTLFSKRMQKRPFFWLGFLGINIEAVIYE